MAIVAAFSGIPLAGAPDSFAVQFTDESTGSPTHWWWDFGDGGTSESQHPSHTYSGSYGDTFTVTLKAFIGGTESFVATMLQYEHKIKTASTFGSIQEAFDDLVAKSFTTQVTGGALKSWYFSDGVGTPETPTYNAQMRKGKGTISLPAPGGAGPSNFRLKYQSTQVQIQEGTIDPSVGSGSYIAGESGLFVDVTTLHGVDIELIPVEVIIVAVPPQEAAQQAGVGCSVALWETETASADNTDETTKVNYISFGTPPVAEFTGSPLSGSNPLEVQFENLSTPAQGLPTTYSWKKRISGSGDAFVEFSTEENPIHIFSK